jgi:carboxymethylenebutenolidase
VILLPGSSGWQLAYPQIAENLADAGFVAMAIDYYAETGPDSSDEGRMQKWPLWQATVRNAVGWLQASPGVSGRRVGLVGYSQGAFLAVSIASSIPAVKAVVDFFGGGSTSAGRLEQEASNFPPLLILHGEADTVVPVSSAFRLRDAVITQGGEVEIYVYPGAGHGFNAPWSPMYSESEASDSSKRMIEFLRRRLAE